MRISSRHSVNGLQVDHPDGLHPFADRIRRSGSRWLTACTKCQWHHDHRRSHDWTISLDLSCFIFSACVIAATMHVTPTRAEKYPMCMVDEIEAGQMPSRPSGSMHVPPSPRQTPGVTWLEEILRVPKDRGGQVSYALRTSGFPRDRTYTVFAARVTHVQTDRAAAQHDVLGQHDESLPGRGLMRQVMKRWRTAG